MKYTAEFSKQIRELDSMVILQKELDLYEHKKRHTKKMMALSYQDRSQLRFYEKEFRELTRHMLMLQKQMAPNQELINCPRFMISRYMELYQVSIPSVARTLGIPTHSILSYLNSGTQTTDTKSFIYWAIRNFRLDGNRYWNLIESIGQKEAI